MKKKVTITLLLLILISGLGFYKWQVIYGKGEFDYNLNLIHAEGYLPYMKNTVKISLIDTGVKKTNKFLEGSNISQIYLDDYSKVSKQYHGTMVVGILTANGKKNSDPRGLIPHGEIISIQSGTDLGMSSEQLAKAINLSIDKGAKIINISLGTTKNTALLKKSVQLALSKGIVIVASNGNDSNNETYYPASYEGVISVGAINKEKEVVNISDMGKVDIFAPGAELLTTRSDEEDQKGNFGGNSAATPIVTSIVAFLLSEHPDITPENVESILINNSDLVDYKNQEIRVINLEKIITTLSKRN
jgi:subtilisin family serine protease